MQSTTCPSAVTKLFTAAGIGTAMRVALLCALLVLTACGGGVNPEEKFWGVWQFTSGTKEGLSCFDHLPESISVVGTEVAFIRNDSWRGSPEEVSILGNFFRCAGEVWLVADTVATPRPPLTCPFGQRMNDRGSQVQALMGSLTWRGQTIAVDLSQRNDWSDQGQKIESCIYTYKNAILSFVRPLSFQ